MYKGDEKVTVFDKGNAQCRLTVTVNGDIRVKISKDVPEEHKEMIFDEMIRKGKEISKVCIKKTYRKTLYYNDMIKDIECG